MTSSPHAKKPPRNPGGRPAKFNEPSRPVTITLPTRILALLETVDADRAKAITRLTEASLAPNHHRPPVEIVKNTDGRSLLLVANCPPLRAIPWLSLVEIAPGRNLLSLRRGIPIEKLELTISDLLAATPKPNATDRRLLRDLLACLREPRRKQTVKTEEIILISPHTRRMEPLA